MLVTELDVSFFVFFHPHPPFINILNTSAPNQKSEVKKKSIDVLNLINKFYSDKQINLYYN